MPVLALAAVAFVVGVIAGARHVPSAEELARDFTAAWSSGDTARMYDLTDAQARGRSAADFAAAYRAAATTATATRIRFGEPRRTADDVVTVPAVADTRVFGPVEAPLVLEIVEQDGRDVVRWTPALVFPGLRAGEALTRELELPPRADLLARDGVALAEGPARTSPLGEVASSIAGALGPIPEDRRAQLAEQGVPLDAQVGVSGLERIFDDALRGRPGGLLLAGTRRLASRPPMPARAVRTTIAPDVQRAALTALAGRLGGIVAMRPRSGEVLAAVGIPLSGLQPPGSTMKIVTVTAGLEARLTSPGKAYPVEREATLEGVPLENNNGEACGGTLVQSFAHSCNSVFAPMGAQVGARRLVATAERFGFNRDPGIPGAATPTIPPAEEIGDDLALGASAIGQGRVQATALTMTVIAATIADRGRRPQPTFRLGERRGFVRVTTPAIAAKVERMMEAVVQSGTGTAAAIPGRRVAGKTGTAELVDTRRPLGELTPPTDDGIPDTDAWFVAYAPGGKRVPRVAVGVLLVRAGTGGAVAAPAARQVLVSALG